MSQSGPVEKTRLNARMAEEARELSRFPAGDSAKEVVDRARPEPAIKAKLLGRFLLVVRQHTLQILRSFFFVSFQVTGEKVADRVSFSRHPSR